MCNYFEFRPVVQMLQIFLIYSSGASHPFRWSGRDYAILEGHHGEHSCEVI